MRSALESVARQSKSLEEKDHRPWPVPKRMWLLGQSWLDLLFAHRPVEREQLEPHVPPPLELETFDGQAWITASPFVVEALRLAATPPAEAVRRFDSSVRRYNGAGPAALLPAPVRRGSRRGRAPSLARVNG
jgi:hypothetical protein